MSELNSSKPLVSVIIPTYNHAHFLKKCLQSVVDQSFSDWEALVINNFSEDHTIDIVKSFGDTRIHLVNFRNNGIIAASRNEGLRLARGEIIAFLDSDDWWYPNKLDLAVKYLEGANVVYHDLIIHNQKGRNIFRKLRARRLKKPVFVDLMTSKTVLFNSSVVARKSIINRVGNLSEDESLVGAEDSDLWLKIARVTDKFVYIPKSLGAYWTGGGNVTEVSEKQIERAKSLYNRHFSELKPNDRKEAELFMSYSIGRIKQKLGFKQEAKSYFRHAMKSKNIQLKLKSIIAQVFNSMLSNKLTMLHDRLTT